MSATATAWIRFRDHSGDGSDPSRVPARVVAAAADLGGTLLSEERTTDERVLEFSLPTMSAAKLFARAARDLSPRVSAMEDPDSSAASVTLRGAWR